jgi:diguanylate cyclase (GGDEF)-like protein
VVEIQREVIAQARQQMASLYDLANHDGLTNLFNQRYFNELMERHHERSLRRREPYTLVFIDLDDLKLLNTRYGHDGGSRALHELAGTIMVSIRSTDVAVRLGGDEFVVLLHNCEQQTGVEFGNRLCARLRDLRFEIAGQSLSITVSCGVAAFPRDGITWSELLNQADVALRRSKALGKNRVTGAEPALEAQAAQS